MTDAWLALATVLISMVQSRVSNSLSLVLASEKYRPKTTICTPFGLLGFNHIEESLSALSFDNIVVYPSSVEQDLQWLKMVLG